ncbi:Trk system potassium transporter TrkA [Mariprofundus ferrooxydans]|uniref:Trk system potassium uptake protein TrkA n=1 Tax=Mariprofundus ferrooxydans PV-1 TaxID=314345 RepID=Q0F0K8_9PROT|nr:Trk system potassium transporter TrkA [Mariprofundus ferrooxydans]EAU55020.1 K+ transport systems, NAD-binding component [Mariprofundus ferrooxydans PV-1]KON48441.1 potassium transporter [Mariprofundus ferrooxydans]
MNVVILGAGEVGYHIAIRLATEGNDVCVVDQDETRLQVIADAMDVRTVCGKASYPAVLEQAGTAHADLLIAVTTNDEVNMLACQVAHSLFKVPTKLARVREQDYVKHPELFGRDDLPIDKMISPEGEAAKVVMGRLNVSSAQDAREFFNGAIELVEVTVRPKSKLAGLALKELPDVMGALRVYVVAHEHNNRWRVPRGDTVLLAGDSIYVTVEKKHLDTLMQTIDLAYQTPAGRNVMMIGGGRIGYLVAKELELAGAKVKIIEFNAERAEWLSEHLNNVVVIYGDALDRKLLEEENIDRMDDFLALTNDDENNILGSLIAKRYGVGHVVTLVNKAIYMQLMRQIGLDVTVSPRLSTVATILSHIRKGRIHGMASLADGQLEVLEAEALATSSILDIPLKHLKLPDDTVVGAIMRGDEIIIPNGLVAVKTGDHVLMVTTTESIPQVEKLFAVHLEFF